VFKALDPDRWAKEVEVHKRLADEKANALVEEAQRKFDAEKNVMSKRESAAVTKLLLLYGEAVSAAVTLLAWIPKSRRLKAIEGAGLSADSPLKPTLLRDAQEAPDLGPDLPSLFKSVSELGV